MGRRLIEEEFMASSPLSSGANAPVLPAHWRDFVALTKPRVMTLVVFTGLCGLLAAPGHIHPVLGFTAILCIALGAGAAAALNQWWEADIDAKMKRTASRPLPAGRMERQTALHFGVGLSFFSVILMGMATNWLAAAVLTVSILFYVFIYSLWLKRTSRQNIVIGGAAGAVPVLVGWAAVQNSLSWEPFILFIAIFLWTPPHFWALAIRHADEYKAAGVPMMPSVVPMKQTVRQMFIYTVLLAVTTLILGPVANLGLTYMISAVILGLGFIASTVDLGRHPSASRAMRVFGFSITYVTVLFTAMAVDVFVKHGL